MRRARTGREITLELLPGAGDGAPPSQLQVETQPAGTKEDVPGERAGPVAPLPSPEFNLTTLLSGLDGKLLESLGSLRKETSPELEAADTLKGGFKRLPSVENPLYSLNSLNQVERDLLGGMSQEQRLDMKRFVMVECRKDNSSMEVLCDEDGRPRIVELPSAVANVAFPVPDSSSPARRDVELRYVPLKAPCPGWNGVVSTPSLGVHKPVKDASVGVNLGKRRGAKPKSGQRRRGDKGPSPVARLRDIRRFKDGLTLEPETADFIKETLRKSKTKTRGRKRGRTGDIPEDWDEPTDEEILAHLLLSHPPMKLLGAIELKKEIRKVRNRFSAELSRVRKKAQQGWPGWISRDCPDQSRLRWMPAIADLADRLSTR